jgi:16S rRNA (guanine527-N7)-methyltransferase
MDAWEALRRGTESLGVAVHPDFDARAQVFVGELARWSRVSRITGYRAEADRVIHLVLESLLLLKLEPDLAPPLLDIGTGAGAPGLVLKLARPDWPVALVEANRRRANFLRHVLRFLELGGADVYEERAETLREQPELERKFNAVTMRAVAGPEAAVALARPFLTPTGSLITQLGSRRPRRIGRVREVTLVRDELGLRLRRAFLIIRSAEMTSGVPRETRG